jgi:hypothetical protein
VLQQRLHHSGWRWRLGSLLCFPVLIVKAESAWSSAFGLYNDTIWNSRAVEQCIPTFWFMSTPSLHYPCPSLKKKIFFNFLRLAK